MEMTVGTYVIECDGDKTELRGASMRRAYEVASETAARSSRTANVWRGYGTHMAMLASAYPDGRIVGIGPDDAWELAAAAFG